MRIACSWIVIQLLYKVPSHSKVTDCLRNAKFGQDIESCDVISLYIVVQNNEALQASPEMLNNYTLAINNFELSKARAMALGILCLKVQLL